MSERRSFINYLRETLIPDLREDGRDAMADDFQTCIRFMKGEDVVYGWYYTYAYSGSQQWSVEGSKDFYRSRDAALTAMNDAIDNRIHDSRREGLADSPNIMFGDQHISEHKIK